MCPRLPLLCLHPCACMRAMVCIWRPEASLQCLFSFSSVFEEGLCHSLSYVSAGLRASGDSLCLLLSPVTDVDYSIWLFEIGSGDQSLGPHSFTEGSLPRELSSQTNLDFVFFMAWLYIILCPLTLSIFQASYIFLSCFVFWMVCLIRERDLYFVSNLRPLMVLLTVLSCGLINWGIGI